MLPPKGKSTSREVARLAGVSQATVSRVLNGGANVTEATRERVRQAIEQLGYEPNESARQLITGRTHTIGVMIDEIINPFYPQLVDALADGVAKAGYRLLLWKVSESEGVDALRALPQRLVDGVVFTAALLDSPMVAEAVQRHYPLVLLNRYVDGLDCDLVVSDNVGGARRVAQHLHRLGHRHVGIISGPLNTSTARDRAHGFCRFFERRAADGCTVRRVEGDFSYQDGFVGVQRLLADDPTLTGVFAANDTMAMGAMNGLISLGLRVPEDVSVVGFDDIPMASWPIWDLTTAAQPITEMATVGLQLLLKRIHEPDRPHDERVFRTSLRLRGSTAPPSGSRRSRATCPTQQSERTTL